MIKKVNTFSIPPIKVKNFTILPQDQLLEILNWRNSEEVRIWMYSKDKISLENHLNFCQSLSTHTSSAYFLVLKNETAIGVVSLINYDEIEQSGEFGFYLNPQFFKSGVGLDVFYVGLELLFKEYNLNKVIGLVRIENTNAMFLNDFFGMLEVEFVIMSGSTYSKREINIDKWDNLGFKSNTLLKSFSHYVKNQRDNNLNLVK
jgi:UDP-4-amino-4,6-dideoxy-N-acetyl-beta-L-altrosamine N-acetyltransferase